MPGFITGDFEVQLTSGRVRPGPGRVRPRPGRAHNKVLTRAIPTRGYSRAVLGRIQAGPRLGQAAGLPYVLG